MSICRNDHIINDGKDMFNRVRFWSCPECRKERFMYFGLFLLIFIVPVGLYSLVKWDPIISRGSEGETITLGTWIITILWWIILGMFFHYREKTKDLKKELTGIKAVNDELTRKGKSKPSKEEDVDDFWEDLVPRQTREITEEDIISAVNNRMAWEDINELSIEDLERLRAFLEHARKKEEERKNDKALKAIDYNIKEIKEYIEGEYFWNDDNLDEIKKNSE